MKTRPVLFDPLLLMQIALALFFGITGLVFLMNYNSASYEVGRAFAKLVGKNDTLNVVVAVIQLIAGIVLLAGLFAFVPQRYMVIACMAIMVLWVIQIIMSHIAYNFLAPAFIPWLHRLSSDLIVLAGIWAVSTRFS
ncbi:MAG TPA: hypothetical protein PK926_10895 [Spirochaetota bacterium]|nr:hypothetical protein [Spirochaetota bacterium]HPI88443.1 hypothetical protein [Spirochaetota bacterium]HPR48806.1 hypothetical protein [Spirochaetota bacterium]